MKTTGGGWERMFLERKNLKTGFLCLPRSSMKSSIVGWVLVSWKILLACMFLRNWLKRMTFEAAFEVVHSFQVWPISTIQYLDSRSLVNKLLFETYNMMETVKWWFRSSWDYSGFLIFIWGIEGTFQTQCAFSWKGLQSTWQWTHVYPGGTG